MIHVYNEVKDIMKGFKTDMKFLTKFVKRKNVFDEDLISSKETAYLKMVYDARCMNLFIDSFSNSI
jgi:hypothetical protein